MGRNQVVSMLCNGRCCACGAGLSPSNELCLVNVDRTVPWKYPTWHEEHRTNGGVAVVCHGCYGSNRPVRIRYLVEIDGNAVIYHYVDQYPRMPDFPLTQGQLDQFLLNSAMR